MMQYSDMWTRSIQGFSYDAVLIHWLQTDELLSAEEAGNAMGSTCDRRGSSSHAG